MATVLITAMRPRQWVKNVFLFAPLVFSKNLFHLDLLGREVAGFALFCCAASAVYLGNDVLDAEADRLHPVKKHRPVASGKLPARIAAGFAALLAATAIGVGYVLSPAFAAVIFGYLVMNSAYTTFLKKLAYVDVVIIATGFVLRVLAGAFAIAVPTSAWLFVCTFFLALFLGLGKRKHELAAAEAEGMDGAKARKALARYDLRVVDRFFLVAGASAVLAFVLYTVAPETQAKFGTWMLALTLPFPAFGVWRFRALASRADRPSSPTEALITDLPFVLNVLAFTAAVVTILYTHAG